MPKAFFTFAQLVASLLSLSMAQAAETQRYTIAVTADPSKVNGQPWDGFGGGNLGGRASVMVPTSGPPDLALCIVVLDGSSSCLDRRQGGKRYSLCQDSYDCDYERVELPGGVVGLIVTDIDTNSDDLVDFLILHTDDTGTEEQTARLEQTLRQQVARMAPAFLDGEKQRRARQVLELNAWDCIEKECRLRQSKIQFKQVR